MTSPSNTEAPPLTLLSVVIPARDEEGCIASTIEDLHSELRARDIPHEIVAVDDGSKDGTWDILQQLKLTVRDLRPIQNLGPHGFGRAVICGINAVQGDAVVIMMADASDDSHDAIVYWDKLNEGYDAVFGSRFIKGGRVVDYPKVKYAFNRLTNWFIKVLFRIRLNDTTNAFKAYRRATLEGLRPFLSPHYNLTVELPLKAIVRDYSWTVVPISWQNRRSGVAKLKIREMGSRYLFIILYCWLERYFSRGDYRKEQDRAR
jgi:dolichol-phosphate mannosyltransferase